jgi:Uma2 family endonuclease
VQPSAEKLPPLEPGDHLDQKTFHARYEAMPEHVRAELIEGVVYLPSPLKPRHGRPHSQLMGWLMLYKAATPGTDVLDNTTAILGEFSEPQPDACPLILPEYGGQTRETEDDYLAGAPELVAEVASSSEAYDLHSKRRDYEKAGVLEYLVLIVRSARAVWFVRRDQGFQPLAPGPDGILRSELFGGLWLDAAALFHRDTARVHEVLRQGLASADHAGFLQRLKRP